MRVVSTIRGDPLPTPALTSNSHCWISGGTIVRSPWPVLEGEPANVGQSPWRMRSGALDLDAAASPQQRRASRQDDGSDTHR